MQNDLSDLKEALERGLSVVTELWNFQAKDWVTSVHAEDINNDGDMEILVGSRDGRVYALTNGGKRLWESVVGSKKWIGAVVGIAPFENEPHPVSVLVGTQDGKVYALDEDGLSISKDRQALYQFEKSSPNSEKEPDKNMVWHSSGYEIRQLAADLKKSPLVVIDSEDRSIHTLDYITGEPGWTFLADSAVRTVFCYDIDNDGNVETLFGTSNQHLYVLNSSGICIRQDDVQGQIHTIYAADLNHDGQVGILLGIDGKTLSLYPLHGQTGWRHLFSNRFLAVCVADVDGDGANEILVGSEDKYLYILDKDGHEIWRYLIGYRISSLYVSDIDNDGQVEIIAGAHDNKVHILRISLIGELYEKIHALYRDVERPLAAVLEELLPRQRALLQALVTEARPTSKPDTLEQAERLLLSKKYEQALAIALTLEQQKVQHNWKKGQIGIINTLCPGNSSTNAKFEIIAGTNKGRVHAFSPSGQELWSLSVGKQVLGVQTGYLNAGKWADIIAYSTDGRISVIKGSWRDKLKKHAPLNEEVKQEWQFDEQLSSLYVTADGKRGPFQIVIGTKNRKIVVYGRDLAQPLRTIEGLQGIRVVSACISHENDTPVIVAGSEGDADHTIYAYTLNEAEPFWKYKTKGRVEALCIKDIDGDTKLEVIVGSQDRNVHVLDQRGNLKWRYYLPDIVSTVDVCDINRDGKLEVLAGCDDGQLCVFSRDGDLLWTYQAYGSILTVRADDIDNDKNVEIIIGTENQLEVVRVVDQKRLLDLINECWLAWQQQKHGKVSLSEFLNHQSASLRAFAMRKMAEQHIYDQNDFKVFETYVKDGSVEVRKALIQAVVSCYRLNPGQAQYILSQLIMDSAQEVRLTLVRYIGILMRNSRRNERDNHWDDGFKFLQRLAKNNDRVVRRAVMRELYTLVEDFYGIQGRKRAVFGLLLAGLQEPESSVKASEWVNHEAARTMAHFLDLHHNELIMYMNLLVAKEVKAEILQRIAYHAENAFIRDIFQDLGAFMIGLDETNVAERLGMAVNTLEQTKALKYGEEILSVYKELYYLIGLNTIEDIASYQCSLQNDVYTPTNTHFPAAVNVFKQLNFITRALRLYLRRDGIRDQVHSLLEANKAFENVRKYAEQEYLKTSLNEPLAKLPDRQVLMEIILKRWQAIINTELLKLNGEARLEAEIQTRRAFREEQVVVWVMLRNTGGSTADNVYMGLLASNQFEVVGKSTFQTEAIFAGDEVMAEFTIRPSTLTPNLVFEIVYVDTERSEKTILFDGQLELYTRAEQPTFTTIPNPYSTGVPRTDMCYGREDNLKFLKENLTRRDAGTFLILHGERRSGKTTLLFQLANTPILEPHIALRIDMQNEAHQFKEGLFFYTIAYYIQTALAKRGTQVPLSSREEFEKHSSFSLNRFLDVVEESLQGRMLVVLIDEFEILEALVNQRKLAPEVFNYLRSMVQNRQNITFLLAGVHTIQKLTAGYWSPFFNIANQYRLSKLSEQGAMTLITKPVEGFLEYDPYAVQKIRQLTADQPYLIHLICRPLIDYCNELKKAYVTMNDVNAIVKELMESKQNHFQWLWNQSRKEERHVLSILAESGMDERRHLSLVEIEAQYKHYSLPYKRESVLAALANLVEREVVEKVENHANEGTSYERYRLPVGLVREWLRKHKSVKQVQHEGMIADDTGLQTYQ